MELEHLFRDSPCDVTQAHRDLGTIQKLLTWTFPSGGKLPRAAEEDMEPSGQGSGFSVEGAAEQFYLHHQHHRTPGTLVRREPPGVTQWESAGFLQGKGRSLSETQAGSHRFTDTVWCANSMQKHLISSTFLKESLQTYRREVTKQLRYLFHLRRGLERLVAFGS